MKKYTVILLLILLFLTGCEQKELSDLSIGTVLGIDKKGKDYIVTSLVVGKEENETLLYTGTGESITNALNNLNLSLAADLYLNHVQAIIISDQIAKEGLSAALDYFIKNDEIKNNFYLFLAKEVSAKKVLETLLKSNHGDYNSITNLFKYNDEIKYTNKSDTITEFIDTLLMKGKDPTLNSVTVKDKKVIASDMAIFKKDKQIASSKNMIGIALLSHKADHIILHIPCDGKESVIQLGNIKVATTYKRKQINHQIKGTIQMKENACHYDLKKEEDLKKVSVKIKKELHTILNKTIEENKKTKSDILGYGALMVKKNKLLKDDYLENLKVKYRLSLRLKKESTKEMFHE